MIFRSRRKVFCIGNCKTGTTSMAEALSRLGFKVGDQAAAELLVEDWARRDFRRLIRYCKSADAFQDVPFALDYTYVALDQAFPGAKFILTVRNSSAEWFESLVRFHTKIINKNRIPTEEDLRSFPYRQKGWMWRTTKLIYPDVPLYDRERYIADYEQRNEAIQSYFRHRPDDLLTLNLSMPTAMRDLCRFLDLPQRREAMPHLNASC